MDYIACRDVVDARLIQNELWEIPKYPVHYFHDKRENILKSLPFIFDDDDDDDEDDDLDYKALTDGERDDEPSMDKVKRSVDDGLTWFVCQSYWLEQGYPARLFVFKLN